MCRTGTFGAQRNTFSLTGVHMARTKVYTPVPQLRGTLAELAGPNPGSACRRALLTHFRDLEHVVLSDAVKARIRTRLRRIMRRERRERRAGLVGV